MRFNWLRLRGEHPQLFAALIFLKRWRTKVGMGLAAVCLAEGLYEGEAPFDLDQPNVWVLIGLGLVLAGVGLRFAAYGYIKKKEALATAGVYSLCRHPLYLGSILLTYGFCFLSADPANFAWATAYFAVFYSITIAWEEVRLSEQYGDAHRAYCRTTPLLLPWGRFRAGVFEFRQALAAGGLALIAAILGLLMTVEAMAELMR